MGGFSEGHDGGAHHPASGSASGSGRVRVQHSIIMTEEEAENNNHSLARLRTPKGQVYKYVRANELIPPKSQHPHNGAGGGGGSRHAH